MSARGHRRRSWRELGRAAGLVGLAALAAHGCAASNSGDIGSGGSGGHQGSGGSSSSGSGGSSGSGTGGSSGSGGAHGSGGATGAGGATGSGGSSAGSGGATGAGGAPSGTGGAAAMGCHLIIQPVSPLSFDQIEAGPDVKVRVQGSAYEVPAMPLAWSWQVTASSDGRTVPTTAVDAQNTLVEFPVEKVDSYRIVATVSGDRACQPAMQVVTAAAAQGPSFTLRITAAGFPVQETRVKLADGPSGSFQLDPGQSFTVKPVDSTQNTLLGTYVQISSPDTSFDIEGDTTRTPLTTLLLPSLTYDLLIVSADAATPFAPLLKTSRPADWSPGLIIDQGTLVSARTLAADGTPIANARLQLRRGAVPSTVGFSDATGALAVWTRDGSMSAIVVPPDGSGLPVARTTDAGVVSAGGAPLAVTMRWAAVASGTLTVAVRASDGVTPIANAQVRLASAGAPYSAGTLTVQTPGADDVTLATTASVTDSLVTDDGGDVTFPPFPAGSYAVTVIPPAAAAPAATTTVAVTLTAAGAQKTIALAQQVPLTGTLRPLAGAAGAVVTAIDVGDACAGTSACTAATDAGGQSAPTSAVVSGQAGDDGTFSLAVAPDRTYQLIVQPAAVGDKPLGRAVLPPFRVCSTAATPCQATNDGVVGTITLPAGLNYQGSLNGPHAPVGGAFVQVFCAPSSPGCVDPTVSLAEATSLGDGSFGLVLPDGGAQQAP